MSSLSLSQLLLPLPLLSLCRTNPIFLPMEVIQEDICSAPLLLH
jgi:hypothetical protein